MNEHPPRPASAAPSAQAAKAAVDEFLAQVSAEFDALPRQLKLIAQYLEKHSDQIGLERVRDVADRCGVQPSALVRFAQHFGFSGYSQMQRLFREGIRQQLSPGRNYQARIREVIEHAQGALQAPDIAHGFISGAIAGMQELQRDLHGSALSDAVNLLAGAQTIWLVGSRRSFPVAAYLAYALQHTDKAIQLVHGIGAMQEGQLRGLKADDVMIATTFASYAEESVEAARHAVAQGARLIVITDSRMNPLAQDAKVLLQVEESSTFGFRALTNTMCLAQSLFIALAYQLELNYQPSGDRSAPPSSSAGTVTKGRRNPPRT